MNLFLVENDRTVDLYERSPEYHEGKDVTVCFNYLVYLRLKKEGGKHVFIFIEDLFDAEDYKSLHSVTDHFAFNWYRRDGKDHALIGGTSFGEMVRVTFSRTYMLTILVKYGEAIRKSVKRWPGTEKIFHDFSNSHNSFWIFNDDRGRFFNKQRLVEQVARQLNRGSGLLTPSVFVPSVNVAFKHCYGRKTLMRRAKDTVRGMLIEAGALIAARPRSHGNIYFFAYYNINSILDHMEGNFIVSGSGSNILNPRRFSKLRFLQFDDIKYKLNGDEKRFLESLEDKYLAEGPGSYLDGFFAFNGIDYGFVYFPAVKDLVHNVIPGLMRYMGKVQKAIKQFGISKIIIFEEIDEQFQAIIAACRATGTTSVWVDHGIQGSDHAQKVCDRGKSDLVICPGTFFVDHYRAQKGSEGQLTALGNPTLDVYGADKFKHVVSVKDVLFLSFEDNFYGRLDRFAYQERYYEEIFLVFNELLSRGVRVHFKPHPAFHRDYFEYLFDFFNIDSSRIDYIQKAPFSKIVYEMDLVVCNVTSCFYEAQAAGVPTVFLEPHFNPEALLPPLNGINGEEVLRVSTGKEILDIISENRDNPEKLNRFLKGFLEKHANKYMGPLDGMAGSRIVKYLCK